MIAIQVTFSGLWRRVGRLASQDRATPSPGPRLEHAVPADPHTETAAARTVQDCGSDDQPVRHKVLAYLLRTTDGAPEVAVFDHVDYPEAGTQVPSGTIDPGESPQDACLREVAEEAGITDAQILAKIGVFEFVHHHRRERHHRHVFALAVPTEVPDEWIHEVSGSGGDRGLKFRFSWMDASEAVSRLVAEQGTYLVATVGDSRVSFALNRTGRGAPTAGITPLTESVTIRAARREDNAALMWLWTALGTYHRTIEKVRPVRWSLRSQQTRRNLLEEVWADPTHHAMFVAETVGGIVGFVRATLSESGPCPGRIETLFVAHDQRGRGAGTQLLKRACDWCRERGATDVSVEFIAPNGDARSFYEAAGFKPLLVTYMQPAPPPQ